MAELRQELECTGLRVTSQWPAAAATLRYFSEAGDLALRLRSAGFALPGTGRARDSGRDVVLAWRSPSETLCLAGSERALAELRHCVEGAADGCLVVLTGALTLMRLQGERTQDLLVRLGGSATVPAAGDSRRGRLGDIAVLALRPTAGETWLVVESGLAEHLWGWISQTLLDFT